MKNIFKHCPQGSESTEKVLFYTSNDYDLSTLSFGTDYGCIFGSFVISLISLKEILNHFYLPLVFLEYGFKVNSIT